MEQGRPARRAFHDQADRQQQGGADQQRRYRRAQGVHAAQHLASDQGVARPQEDTGEDQPFTDADVSAQQCQRIAVGNDDGRTDDCEQNPSHDQRVQLLAEEPGGKQQGQHRAECKQDRCPPRIDMAQRDHEAHGVENNTADGRERQSRPLPRGDGQQLAGAAQAVQPDKQGKRSEKEAQGSGGDRRHCGNHGLCPGIRCAPKHHHAQQAQVHAPRRGG